MAVAVTWWAFWAARQTDWTALRFAAALVGPCLLIVRASILVGSDPFAITSYRDHFFANRVRFFAISIVYLVASIFAPMIGGAPASLLLQNLAISTLPLVVTTLGLVSANPRLHGVLAIVQLAATAAALFVFEHVPQPLGGAGS